MINWKRMRQPESGATEIIGERGRYLLLLDPPLVNGQRHWIHFSWRNNKCILRDYIRAEYRDDLNPQDVWSAAIKRIPCTGKYYKSYIFDEFWIEELTKLAIEEEINETT